MTDSESGRPVDRRQARLDPGSVFAAPEDVIRHKRLTKAEKTEILRRWAYDASEEDVATEEGMPAGEDGDLLRRILLSLNELVGGVDVENVSSAKQHGIPYSADERD